MVAEQIPAGAGSAGAAQAQARLPVRDVVGGTIGLAMSLKVPEGIKISIHSESALSMYTAVKKKGEPVCMTCVPSCASTTHIGISMSTASRAAPVARTSGKGTQRTRGRSNQTTSLSSCACSKNSPRESTCISRMGLRSRGRKRATRASDFANSSARCLCSAEQRLCGTCPKDGTS